MNQRSLFVQFAAALALCAALAAFASAGGAAPAAWEARIASGKATVVQIEPNVAVVIPAGDYGETGSLNPGKNVGINVSGGKEVEVWQHGNKLFGGSRGIITTVEPAGPLTVYPSDLEAQTSIRVMVRL